MAQPELGAEIGRGLRSVVYAWGDNLVIKVPVDNTPDSWTEFEQRYTRAAARTSQIAVPEQVEVIGHAGRRCSIASRVWGPSMIDLLVEDPSRAASFGVMLADVQRSLFDAVPSLELPRQTDRLSCKVRLAGRAHGSDYGDVLAFLRSNDEHQLVLCHGDLHPRNVLIEDDGPVLIDWFDACRGHRSAEIARSLLLLEQFGSTELTPDLAMVDPSVFDDVAVAYRRSILETVQTDDDELDRWMLVQRIARSAEGLGPDSTSEINAMRARLF